MKRYLSADENCIPLATEKNPFEFEFYKSIFQNWYFYNNNSIYSKNLPQHQKNSTLIQKVYTLPPNNNIKHTSSTIIPYFYSNCK